MANEPHAKFIGAPSEGCPFGDESRMLRGEELCRAQRQWNEDLAGLMREYGRPLPAPKEDVEDGE